MSVYDKTHIVNNDMCILVWLLLGNCQSCFRAGYIKNGLNLWNSWISWLNLAHSVLGPHTVYWSKLTVISVFDDEWSLFQFGRITIPHQRIFQCVFIQQVPRTKYLTMDVIFLNFNTLMKKQNTCMLPFYMFWKRFLK